MVIQRKFPINKISVIECPTMLGSVGTLTPLGRVNNADFSFMQFTAHRIEYCVLLTLSSGLKVRLRKKKVTELLCGEFKRQIFFGERYSFL
jgi:hypothetical protein